MKVRFDVYPDVYAFRESITTRRNTGKLSNESQTAGSDWAGMPYEQAVKALTEGVPADVERMKKDVAEFTAKTLPATKHRPKNHYYGRSPNVPAAIIGLPKSMRYTERVPQKSKIVTLIYSMGALSDVSAEDLTNAACAAVKLAAYLEVNGYRVNLYSCPSMAEHSGEVAACIIKLKDSKQPLDIAKLSFSMGNVAMFRRLGFRWRETCPTITGYWGSMYGATIYEHGKALKVLQEMGISTENTHYFNMKDCKRAGFDAVKLAANLGIIKGE